jgi:uncharacterized damage-inducible protein DinB
MNWTAPEPAPIADGPLVGDDRAILSDYLNWARRTLLNLCAGLSAEQLATAAVPPSNLTLLGLVRHMTKVERTWFRQRVAGQDIPGVFDAYADKDADFEQIDPARAAEELERYAEECRLAEAAVADLPMDTTFEWRDQTGSLRFVYVHMLAEYSRHNGHGDLLRQCLDGATGR